MSIPLLMQKLKITKHAKTVSDMQLSDMDVPKKELSNQRLSQPPNLKIFVRAADTGFTTEKKCAFTGLKYHDLDTDENDVVACRARCENDATCKAFIKWDLVGTRNCRILQGVQNQNCEMGDSFSTFGRKCELVKECAEDKSHCAVSRIPVFPHGP